jgi:hypothetical protein
MRKLFYVLLLLPFFAVSQENGSFLLNLTEITVENGHNAQFTEGVKSWKKCYKDNDGKDPWSMWKRVQGEGTVYTMTSTMANWAEMDKEGDVAGKECRMNVVNLIMPHVKSISYNIASSMPQLSRSTPMPEDTKLVWVYNVKTSNSTSFKEVIGELSSAMKKANGEIIVTWYALEGGAPEVADYFVAVPYKNFAELDIDSDGPWKTYEKANGKVKADALRAKFRSSVSSDWSYMYSLNDQMSY